MKKKNNFHLIEKREKTKQIIYKAYKKLIQREKKNYIINKTDNKQKKKYFPPTQLIQSLMATETKYKRYHF